ncbi:hypothetical protein GYH30_044843 [Glycine max]|nr:hypothetical protein GYH30_044843 [Glycine max]
MTVLVFLFNASLVICMMKKFPPSLLVSPKVIAKSLRLSEPSSFKWWWVNTSKAVI